MHIVRVQADQIEKIVAMSVRAFETDVNAGGAEGDCPPEFDSPEWHARMAREGHLYQAAERSRISAIYIFALSVISPSRAFFMAFGGKA